MTDRTTELVYGMLVRYIWSQGKPPPIKRIKEYFGWDHSLTAWYHIERLIDFGRVTMGDNIRTLELVPPKQYEVVAGWDLGG